jgi:integrase/recombinase XerD
MAEISPLRRRMMEDMTVRNLSPATQRSYVSAVSKFSRFFGRSPDTPTLEDVRTFQVHLASKGVAWALGLAEMRSGSPTLGSRVACPWS